MKYTRLSLLLLVCVIGISSIAQADTLTPSEDTFIVRGDGSPWNWNSGTNLQVWGNMATGESVARTLVKFDVSAYAGQTVSDATFTVTAFYHNQANVGALGLYQVHSTNAAWDTGLGNISYGAPYGACWKYAVVGTAADAGVRTLWKDENGVDLPGDGTNDYSGLGGPTAESLADTSARGYDKNALDTVDLAGLFLNNGTLFTPVDLEFTVPAATIQGWIDDPSSNAGLLLRFVDETDVSGLATPTAGTGKLAVYSSRNGSSVPSLTFDVVPEPATLTCLMLGGLVAIGRKRLK